MPFVSRLLSSISDIAAETWNAITGTDYPFLLHEFLHALEASGSVSRERGWQPLHLLVYDDNVLCAVLPLYVKNHSYGEYVFDWSWAEAYQRYGYNYYPKLLSAIPFTPAQGPRLAYQHTDPQALFTHIANTLSDLCIKEGYSGWHVLFTNDEENNHWQQTTALERVGCQFHWFNQNYRHFDDFLAACSSRKRKNLRKERQKVANQGVTLERLTGEQILPEHIETFYGFYQSTYARLSGHGGYLTKTFFQQLLKSPLKHQLLLVMAYQDDQAIAAAINFFSANTLYGRYWGADRDIDCLHFEACYYQGIEFCIEKGLHRFDPGAQGEHKIQRGFTPLCTFSWHWLAEKPFYVAIQQALADEKVGVQNYAEEAKKLLPYHFMHHYES